MSAVGPALRRKDTSHTNRRVVAWERKAPRRRGNQIESLFHFPSQLTGPNTQIASEYSTKSISLLSTSTQARVDPAAAADVVRNVTPPPPDVLTGSGHSSLALRKYPPSLPP